MNKSIMPILRKLAYLVLIAVFPLASDASGLTSLHVIDSFGKPIKSFRLVIKRIGNGHASVVKEVSDRASLEPGTYKIEAYASLHQPVTKHMVIKSGDDSRNIVLIPLTADQISGDGESLFPTLDARLDAGYRNQQELHIRLVSVYTDYSFEARVQNDLRFRIESVPLGDYIVMVYSHFKLIGVHRFTFTADKVGASMYEIPSVGSAGFR